MSTHKETEVFETENSKKLERKWWKTNNSDNIAVGVVGIPTQPTNDGHTNMLEKTYNNGYNRNGGIVPFFDGVTDETQKDKILEKEDKEQPVPMDGLQVEEEPKEVLLHQHVAISDVSMKMMEIKDIKCELAIHCIVPNGRRESNHQLWNLLWWTKLVAKPINEFSIWPSKLCKGEELSTKNNSD